MNTKTCKWCGKRYYPGLNDIGYCSKRCEVAGEAQRKKERDNSWFVKWWRSLSTKWKIILIGGLLIVGYIGSCIDGLQ